MRLDIRYRMTFAYDKPVWESQNEIRVRPREDGRQHVIAYRLTPAPAAKVLSFMDYWGTNVDHVGIRQPHMSFQLVAEAAVETTEPTPISRDPDASELTAGDFATSAAEYLAPSPHVRWTDELLELASSAEHNTVLKRVDAVVALVHGRLVYEAGTTKIGTSLSELLSGGKGVCQDYAHLSIGMLRALGVPARYVSGYLFAADETRIDSDGRDPVSVQTHAWVEVLVPGHGWHPVDPTNQKPVARRHVVIGCGRDYDDVAPVRGTYLGSATPEVDAQVEIQRMASTQGDNSSERPRRLNSEQLDEHRRLVQAQQQQ